MPQDEHNEWPSFKTVLRDVGTSELSPRPERDAPAPRQSDSDAEERLEETPAIQLAPALQTSDSFGSDLLPDPLPPVDIDTSAVRALLLSPSESPIEDFDLRALDPLDTPPLAFETEPAFESESGFEPDSVFDLAFDPDALVASSPFDGIDALYAPEVETESVELPQPDATPTGLFDDLDIAGEISLDDVPQFSDDQLLSGDENVGSADVDELPSGAVFELDEDAITASVDAEEKEVATAEFMTASIDLFDLALSDEEAGGFDSIATANAIEGELNELSDLTALDSDDLGVADDTSIDPFQLDNVIPIRPDAALDDSNSTSDDPSSNWLNPTDVVATPLSHALDGPPPARVSQTGWVGLESVQPKLEQVAEKDEVDDPWAHMRPTEEPKSQGLLAKFFGGDERKKAKARRRAQEQGEIAPVSTEAELEVAFDSACPNCGGECQVDLDDPIGRRVHVSCPSCDHMWFTPYIEANTG